MNWIIAFPLRAAVQTKRFPDNNTYNNNNNNNIILVHDLPESNLRLRNEPAYFPATQILLHHE